MNPEVTNLLKDIYTAKLHEGDEDFIWNDSWVHIWNDMNEPACFMPTDKTMPKSNLHNFGNGEIYEHRDVHSLYGHYNSKATYGALRARSDDRPFILTRSFNAGTQKYAAVWCGDATCSWAHFKKCVPMMLQNSIAGIHFVG
jgi:alpha-glucosidase (family GH31 glycosyl hydrolase)